MSDASNKQAKQHVTLTVKGKVQGVFFRANTRRIANNLSLTGYVQNNKDGSVTIEAEGTQESIHQLEAWCRRGPDDARVDSCEIRPGKLKGYMDFTLEGDTV